MAIEGVNAVTNGGAVSRAVIQQEDFLQVLLAQLRYQDPLKPMDNSEFIAQFAQLTSLEQTQQMNQKLDVLLGLASASQAIELLGRTVEAGRDFGRVIGEVTTISYSGGNPLLTIRTESGESITEVSLGNILLVR